jgi:hypothetical protein
MRGAIPPFPQYAFMAWCLVKLRDNFTFTFSNKERNIVKQCCSLYSQSMKALGCLSEDVVGCCDVVTCQLVSSVAYLRGGDTCIWSITKWLVWDWTKGFRGKNPRLKLPLQPYTFLIYTGWKHEIIATWCGAKTSHLCVNQRKGAETKRSKDIVGRCQVQFDFSFQIYPRRQTVYLPPLSPILSHQSGIYWLLRCHLAI